MAGMGSVKELRWPGAPAGKFGYTSPYFQYDGLSEVKWTFERN